MKFKTTYLLLFTLLPFCALSQQQISPKNNLVGKKWIKNQHYKMKWSALRDTISIPIGVVETKIAIIRNNIQVITNVQLNGNKASWIDTTMVQKADLSPQYHSSYNPQRNMVLNFGSTVTGFYQDKQSGQTTKISQKIALGYFDSNFYPMLINWLPLKEGYIASLNIYDYNPKGKTGIIKANILGVKEGIYQSKTLGKRKVWIVEAADEIGTDPSAKSSYYIDQLSRQLYKQLISTNGRKMEMVLIEDQ